MFILRDLNGMHLIWRNCKKLGDLFYIVEKDNKTLYT